MIDLESAIKALIVDTLHLEDVLPENIDTNAPLFGDGLGLDSIDALEIGIALKKRFGLTLDTKDPAMKEHFLNVRSLAGLIASHQKS